MKMKIKSLTISLLLILAYAGVAFAEGGGEGGIIPEFPIGIAAMAGIGIAALIGARFLKKKKKDDQDPKNPS